MNKKISIIIPCYNMERYMERCIKSLLVQTIGLDVLELIFVNDASTDGTLDILLSYEKEYTDSIIVINSEENRKQGGARNLGLYYASADYIGFVDADDWVEPTMYEKLYNKAVEYDCDVVTCEYKRDFGKAIPITMGLTGEPDKFEVIDSIDKRKEFFLEDKRGGVWSKLYKKKIITESGIFFPENLFYEDNYWFPVISFYIERYYVIEEYLYHYFINFNSTTIKRNSIRHMDRMEIEIMKLKTFMELGVYNTFANEIEFIFIKLYYINTLHYLFSRYDYDKIPTNLFAVLQDNLKKLIPNYKNNIYYDEFSDLDKELLRTVELNLKPEQWIYIAERYCEAYDKINLDEIKG
ncbi:glycosyltransferase [Anaerocolumna sp. MB42-C2]|uniref:glycosyltransferase n=1 Tax=Anaerocolumna sp. MB42-C2 TaxID=3070997 RepID=UPI0027E20EB6|nr:glycosyltransferase [Anaerocolumna sp. MB42-C2]WMJ90225.1 glycosyltransferase [Anaerocolumna sp. MB42-C2]